MLLLRVPASLTNPAGNSEHSHSPTISVRSGLSTAGLLPQPATTVKTARYPSIFIFCTTVVLVSPIADMRVGFRGGKGGRAELGGQWIRGLRKFWFGTVGDHGGRVFWFSVAADMRGWFCYGISLVQPLRNVPPGGGSGGGLLGLCRFLGLWGGGAFDAGGLFPGVDFGRVVFVFVLDEGVEAGD